MSRQQQTVPLKVVQELEKKSNGIQPLIDVLKSCLLDVDYDGKGTMSIKGDDADLLQIALDHLSRSTTAGNPSTCVELKTDCIVWTFKGLECFHLKKLFNADLKSLNGSVETFFKPDERDCTSVFIECKPHNFSNVKLKIKEIQDKLKHVLTSDKMAVEKRKENRIKEFDKFPSDGYFYGQQISENNKKYFILYAINLQWKEQGVDLWKRVLKGENYDKTKSYFDQPGTDKGGSKNKSLEGEDPSKDEVSSKKQDTAGVVDPPKSPKSRAKDEGGSSQGSPIDPQTDDKDPEQQAAAKGPMERRKAEIEGKGDTMKYICKMNDVKVMIYKESITDIKGMNALTNAANDKMMHGGGVAYYISKAAGTAMDDDCRRYIDKNGPIAVTKNYVSIPGKLQCDGIIHAVGPQWHNYRDRREDCAEDLYKTILNVLIEMKEQKWQKVALSAISSGIFGVPKDLCAQMYIKAFAEFAANEPGSVTEIHFIDLNQDILKLVRDAHELWVGDPSKLSFKNALDYPQAGFKTTKKGRKTLDSDKKHSNEPASIKFLGESRTRKGRPLYQYGINGNVTVCVYQGSVTDMEAKFDAVVAPARGRLADAIAEEIGKKHCATQTKKYEKASEGNIYHFPGGKKWPRTNVIHVVYSSSLYDSKSILDISNLTMNVLEYAGKLQVQRIALPILLPGKASHEYFGRFVNGFIIDLLTTVSKSKVISFEEIHIVDVNEHLINVVKAEFRQVTSINAGNYFADRSPPDVGLYGDFDGNKGKGPLPTEADGWTKHRPLPESKPESLSQNKKSLSLSVAKGNSSVLNGTSKICLCCGDKKIANKKLPCGHSCCQTCLNALEKSGMCKECTAGTKSKSKADALEDCPICCETMAQSYFQVLPCAHEFCKACIKRIEQTKPQCPTCQKPFGTITGNQPPGHMYYRFSGKPLAGYECDGSIEICYDIFDGKQGEDHPHPGKPFTGIRRPAFLPDNGIGNQALHLLRRAFDRRLIFTVGDSRTSGREGVVTWNDIHHKTNRHGGPERYGYPDPTYLQRLFEELAAKGVVD